MKTLFANHESKRRLIMTLSGTIGAGIGVGILKFADLGTDPYTTFVTGVSKMAQIPYDISYIIITALLLCVTFLWDKHYIGVATIFNLLLIGKIAQFSCDTLNMLYTIEGLPFRLVALACGLILLGVSSSMYYTADLGVSGYDAIALIAADKFPVKFRTSRMAADILCIIIGLICGETIGLGTFILGFAFGPITSIFNTHISQPCLRGIKKVRSLERV